MQLRLVNWHDPALFRSHVEGSLCEREAENNLVFGILSGIIDGRQKFSDKPPLLCSVEAETGSQLVALRTPPQNLVLSKAKSEEAVSVLARELWAAGHQLPGVNAPSREADIFAETWCEITGARIRREHAQRIYCLDRVNPQRPIVGHLHLCHQPDLALATEWMRAFSHDVGEHQVPADPRRFIGQREAGLFFWIETDRSRWPDFHGQRTMG